MGLAQVQVMAFMEELGGIPISWMYDMLAGDSVGSIHASVANVPMAPGSSKPRYTMAEYNEIFKKIVQETFEPYRPDYHRSMAELEISMRVLERAIERVKGSAIQADSKIDTMLHAPGRALARMINAAAGAVRLGPVFNSVSTGTAQPTIQPVKYLTDRLVLPRLEKMLAEKQGKVEHVFFSPEPIHRILDSRLKFSRSKNPLMLGETITGFHCESFNLDRLEPAYHSVVKPGEHWQGYISDPDLPLSDPPKCSMAAATIFHAYKSPYTNCHYEDIGNQNTLATPMNYVRRLLPDDIQRKGMSIGTGIEKIDLDPVRMRELLILGRLDSEQGAPLLTVPKLYNLRKARRDLEEELGSENVTFIDKVLDAYPVKNKHRYRQMLEEFGGTFSQKFISAAINDEAVKMPESSMIDARAEQLAKIEEFGRAMVWENLPVLVREVKEGLKRAQRQKLVSASFVSQKIQEIDATFPSLKNHDVKRSKSIIDYLTFGGSLPRIADGWGIHVEGRKESPNQPDPLTDTKFQQDSANPNIP